MPGGMEAAGFAERHLSVAQRAREARDDASGEARVVVHRTAPGEEIFDAEASTDAARRRGQRAAALGCAPGHLEARARGGRHFDGVAVAVVTRPPAMRHRANVARVRDEAFCEEKPQGELVVVPGGAHRDGDRLSGDADF